MLNLRNMMGITLVVFSLIGCSSSRKDSHAINKIELNKEFNLLNQEFRTFADEKVYFSFDSAKLSEEAQITLILQADWLNSHKKVTATIEGHCDEIGTQDYNLVLGLKRAKSVRDSLVRHGVEASRLAITSYGKTKPEDISHTKKAHKVNRRTITVINKIKN